MARELADNLRETSVATTHKTHAQDMKKLPMDLLFEGVERMLAAKCYTSASIAGAAVAWMRDLYDPEDTLAMFEIDLIAHLLGAGTEIAFEERQARNSAVFYLFVVAHCWITHGEGMFSQYGTPRNALADLIVAFTGCLIGENL